MSTTLSSNRRLSKNLADADAAGFTLLEMLVVLAIMAVMLTMVVGFNRDSPGLRVHVAAIDLEIDMRWLRQLAIRTHASASLTLIPNGYLIWPGGVTRRLPPGLSIGLLAPGSLELFGRSENVMRCFEDGSCTGGVFLVQDKSAKARVEVRWLDGGVHVHGA